VKTLASPRPLAVALAGLMRSALPRLAVMLATTAVCSAADPMKNHRIEVCGAWVSLDLHPDTTEPSVRPRGVKAANLKRPGDITSFIHVMYDYKGSRKLNVDGSVIVVATVVRRTAEEIAAGGSTFDVDRLIARMVGTGSDLHYEKVERDGETWIKRSKLRDVPAGEGRSVYLEWLVPITQEVLLLFQVELTDYGITKKTPQAREWYAKAEAMQQRIFESLRVERPRPAARDSTRPAPP